MAFESIFNYIKEGNFDYILKNELELFKNLDTDKELEQSLRLCYHFIYHAKSLPSDQLCSMMKLVIFCSQSLPPKSGQFNVAEILKTLCYILAHGIKRNVDVHTSLNLSMEIENLLQIDEELCVSQADSLRKTYSILWNLSLQKGLPPRDALALQSLSLKFLCLAGENLSDVCNNSLKVGRLAEHHSCPTIAVKEMYWKILSAVIMYLKRKPKIHSNSIVFLNLVLIEFAKSLANCNEFSRMFKPLATYLELICDPKVVLSFKMSVKIVEAGMAFMVGKCSKEDISKFLKGCSVISISSLAANTILVDGIICSLQFIEEGEKSEKITAVDLEGCRNWLFASMIGRISNEDNLMKDTFVRVLDVIFNHLSKLIKMTEEESKREEIFKNALKITPPLSILLAKVQNIPDTYIYNIGINCCNLGVTAFKANVFSVAAEFLDLGVQFLNCNYKICDKTQKTNVLSIMKKKALLLKDNLRYSGKYKEATLQAVLLATQNIIPWSEIVPTWIKCKKDAHKANNNILKKLCIKDIYRECIDQVSSFDSPVNADELLIEEIKGLEQLSYEVGEELLVCARALQVSDQLRYSLEGSLTLSRILWEHSTLQSESERPYNIITDLLNRLEKLYMKNKQEMELYHEYQARALFLMYLCKLQEIQDVAKADVEESQKSDEPLTAQSTDLGEEIQPNDACNVRPSSTTTTFATQENALLHLHQALHKWEIVVQKNNVHHPSLACSDLISIGYIYKLSGLLPSCIKAFSLLLALADQHSLPFFWVHGVTELMEVAPELISCKVAQRLHSLLTSKECEKMDKFTYYFKVSSLASLTYYYYRVGQFSTGAAILLDCLSDPLMKKRSPAATEVQIGIYFAASHFAFLPSSVLPSHLKPKQPCLFLALAATRKAIALMNILAEYGHHEHVCWRHKVAWLHHVTNLWLGQLCHLTAQPRLARAYLRQALTLAEKLALPLRTIELLCTLAEIDLQCDQLDDCRVKVDSLDKMLRVHTSSEMSPESQQYTACVPKLAFEEEVKRKPASRFVPIFVDDNTVSERLRDGEDCPDFNLKIPVEVGNELVIGDERRIRRLASVNPSNNQCPSSPSVGFREEGFRVRSVFCPAAVAECPVCVSPELNMAAIRTSVVMAVVHAHRSNFKMAYRCFIQAENDLQKIVDSSKEIESKLSSILAIRLPSHEDEMNHHKDFLQTYVTPVKLCLYFHWNEVRCIEGKNWPDIESNAIKILTEVSNLTADNLATNHPPVVQIILQCNAISRTAQNMLHKLEQPEISRAYDVSPVLKRNTASESRTPSTFKTPARSALRKQTKNLCGRRQQVPSTPFPIFSDQEGNSSSGEKEIKVLISTNGQEDDLKNLTTTLGRLGIEGRKLESPKCSPRFSPLGTLNASPFSQVLKLPNAEDMTEKPVRTRGRTRKITSTTTETATKSPKTNQIISKTNQSLIPTSKMKKVLKKPADSPSEEEASKENSPVVQTDLNLKTRPSRAKSSTVSKSTVKTYSGRNTKSTATIASDNLHAQDVVVTRESRRRNLKRL